MQADLKRNSLFFYEQKAKIGGVQRTGAVTPAIDENYCSDRDLVVLKPLSCPFTVQRTLRGISVSVLPEVSSIPKLAFYRSI